MNNPNPKILFNYAILVVIAGRIGAIQSLITRIGMLSIPEALLDGIDAIMPSNYLKSVTWYRNCPTELFYKKKYNTTPKGALGRALRDIPQNGCEGDQQLMGKFAILARSCILLGASTDISTDTSVDISVDTSVDTRSSIGRYSTEYRSIYRSSIDRCIDR